MVKALACLRFLKQQGYVFFAGVPCSMLQPLLNCLHKDKTVTYLAAVREDVALGLASGAQIAGRKSAILLQNSGLGNIINALTSFNLLYKIPVLIFITWRGYRGKDAPEHIIMGRKTLALLRCLGIPTVILKQDCVKELGQAIEMMRKSSLPVAVILKEGVIVE